MRWHSFTHQSQFLSLSYGTLHVPACIQRRTWAVIMRSLSPFVPEVNPNGRVWMRPHPFKGGQPNRGDGASRRCFPVLREDTKCTQMAEETSTALIPKCQWMLLFFWEVPVPGHEIRIRRYTLRSEPTEFLLFKSHPTLIYNLPARIFAFRTTIGCPIVGRQK
jgi:hypothetical protein